MEFKHLGFVSEDVCVCVGGLGHPDVQRQLCETGSVYKEGDVSLLELTGSVYKEGDVSLL